MKTPVVILALCLCLLTVGIFGSRNGRPRGHRGEGRSHGNERHPETMGGDNGDTVNGDGGRGVMGPRGRDRGNMGHHGHRGRHSNMGRRGDGLGNMGHHGSVGHHGNMVQDGDHGQFMH
ncbi:unnamed protein product [Lymnaea stagnalis]|uniref:Uncharacterized protein n=1 Tax=Lymnaea stagnalis TaxID=6523 RepID=A0AAV2H2W3_LYMST